ncbi:MAG: hypothetical protein RSA44_03460 [Bacteroides sp.]
MRLTRKTLLPILLLILFASYQIGILSFAHTHIINGVMIVHSHPSKDKQHAHSKTELVVINRLNVLTMSEATSPTVLKVDRILLCSLENEVISRWVFPIHLRTLSLRAPPTLIA